MPVSAIPDGVAFDRVNLRYERGHARRVPRAAVRAHGTVWLIRRVGVEEVRALAAVCAVEVANAVEDMRRLGAVAVEYVAGPPASIAR